MIRPLLPRLFSISLGASALLMGGCREVEPPLPANLITRNDFESVAGWMAPPQTLTAELAHSGRYSTKVQPGLDFGMGYSSTLDRVGIGAHRKLLLEAWALRTGTQANAALVVQILDPTNSQQVYWQALDVPQQVKTFNRWMLVRQEFELPAGLAPHMELRVYPWLGQGQQAVFVDDISLRWAD